MSRRWITHALLALAIDLNSARSQGLVGERADGYVAVVANGASPEVKALVKSVNDKRRATYSNIAKKQGIPVEAVAAQAGAKLTSERPKGEWVTDKSGKWRQK